MAHTQKKIVTVRYPITIIEQVEEEARLTNEGSAVVWRKIAHEWAMRRKRNKKRSQAHEQPPIAT